MLLRRNVAVLPNAVWIDKKPLSVAQQGTAMLNEIYHQFVKDYPKYFKMDLLGKLGFLSSELLLQGLEEERFVPRCDRSVLLFNRSASLQTDSRYQETISNPEQYYPSPALFVYTLPNIVTGEIAIRNKYHGETSFFVLENFDSEIIADSVIAAFQDPDCQSQITGWMECSDETHWHAVLLLVERQGGESAEDLKCCLDSLYNL